MATAVRLRRPALIGVGPFGERVVEIMRADLSGGKVVVAGEIDRAFADLKPEVVVAALWRPSPALCERADELSRETGIPWLPVIKEDPVIRVGPLVSPGAGPCFRCYSDRRAQNDREWGSTRALHEAYNQDPLRGPGGYLPQQARLGAAVAATVLDCGIAAPDAVTGSVTTITLNRLSTMSHRVIACHDCDRCGTAFPQRDLRNLLRMAEATYAQAQ